MQALENIALPRIRPKLWVRYVDDTFVIIKRSDIENTQKTINNIFNDIKFTMESENNGELAFLDVLVKRNANGTLETSVYRKLTHGSSIKLSQQSPKSP